MRRLMRHLHNNISRVGPHFAFTPAGRWMWMSQLATGMTAGLSFGVHEATECAGSKEPPLPPTGPAIASNRGGGPRCPTPNPPIHTPEAYIPPASMGQKDPHYVNESRWLGMALYM